MEKDREIVRSRREMLVDVVYELGIEYGSDGTVRFGSRDTAC